MLSDEKVSDLETCFGNSQVHFNHLAIQEEVRMAAYAFASSLFSTHFDVISVCWSALLMTSPITERIRLVSFLVQFHPYFPTWQGERVGSLPFSILIKSRHAVLAWDAVLETLANTGVEDPFGYDRHGTATHMVNSWFFNSITYSLVSLAQHFIICIWKICRP